MMKQEVSNAGYRLSVNISGWRLDMKAKTLIINSWTRNKQNQRKKLHKFGFASKFQLLSVNHGRD